MAKPSPRETPVTITVLILHSQTLSPGVAAARTVP
jgi:hypothetical protein